jgi:hypothetical protein
MRTRQPNLSDTERAVSVGLGVLLVARAFAPPLRQDGAGAPRAPIGRMVIGLAGAELVRRAVSGWCPVVCTLRLRRGVEARDHAPAASRPASRRELPTFTDLIDLASADSFPASDPPSWISVKGATPAF